MVFQMLWLWYFFPTKECLIRETSDWVGMMLPHNNLVVHGPHQACPGRAWSLQNCLWWWRGWKVLWTTGIRLRGTQNQTKSGHVWENTTTHLLHNVAQKNLSLKIKRQQKQAELSWATLVISFFSCLKKYLIRFTNQPYFLRHILNRCAIGG